MTVHFEERACDALHPCALCGLLTTGLRIAVPTAHLATGRRAHVYLHPVCASGLVAQLIHDLVTWACYEQSLYAQFKRRPLDIDVLTACLGFLADRRQP